MKLLYENFAGHRGTDGGVRRLYVEVDLGAGPSLQIQPGPRRILAVTDAGGQAGSWTAWTDDGEGKITITGTGVVRLIVEGL